MEKKGISIQEASKLTGFAESTLQQACVHGEIKSHKEDLKHWTIDVDSLFEYAKNHHPHHNHEILYSINETNGESKIPSQMDELSRKLKKRLRNDRPTISDCFAHFDEVSESNKNNDLEVENMTISYADLHKYGDKRFNEGFIAGFKFGKEGSE